LIFVKKSGDEGKDNDKFITSAITDTGILFSYKLHIFLLRFHGILQLFFFRDL